MSEHDTPFWEKPLERLDSAQWEALCDGCGKCCLHKVEDADSGDIYPTNVACRLLDVTNARCSDYRHRKAKVPDCMQLTPSKLADIAWLPSSCAYVLRSQNKPLPDWHYLIAGDYQAMMIGGHSVAGRCVSEDFAGPLEHHILETPL